MILGFTFSLNKDNFVVFACLYDENINFNSLHKIVKKDITKMGVSEEQRTNFLREFEISTIKDEKLRNQVVEYMLELPLNINFFYKISDVSHISRNIKGEIGKQELQKLIISGASQIIEFLLNNGQLPMHSEFIVPYGADYISPVDDIILEVLGCVKFGGQKGYNEKTGLKYLSFYQKEFNKKERTIKKFTDISI